MGTTVDKIEYSLNAKDDITAAITEQGVEVPEEAPLGQYGDLIRAICTGGGQSDWAETDEESDAYIKNKPLDLVHISDNKEAISIGSEITVSPFKFGIDENGNYGYYKDGADTVTPFKVMSDIELLMDTSPISSASSYITGASVFDGKEFVDYDFLNFIISVTINGKTTSYNNYFAPIVAGFNPTFIRVQAHVPYELTFTATHPTLKAVYYSGNYYITTLKIEGAKNCNPFKNGRG